MICTALSPLIRFRRDPYPWANKPIAFAGGPNGLQACRFRKAEKILSISGDEKWLLKLDEPVIRAVQIDPRGLTPEQLAEAQMIRRHYTRLVWAEECTLDLVAKDPNVTRSFPEDNGSVVEIPDQCFKHIRRADFVNGYTVLDRYVAMYLLYVDDNRPPVETIKRFIVHPAVTFGFSLQGVTIVRSVPYCMIPGLPQKFTDERYCSPSGVFDRAAADELKGKIGGVKL